MPIRRCFFLISYLLQLLVAEAQLVVAIPTNKQPIRTDFHIKILESKATNKIGTIKTSTNQTQTIELKKTISVIFQQYFDQTISTTNDSLTVYFSIDTLWISEIPTTNLLEGTISLKGNFYSIKRSDTLFLTSIQLSQVYRRSVGNINPKNIESLLQSTANNCISYIDKWILANRQTHEAFVKNSQVIILPDYAISDADTLYYSAKPISWDDFKGQPKSVSKFGASIFANIAYQLTTRTQDGSIVAQVTSKVYMVRGISWVLPTNRNDYALRHEQLHFDIAQVVMNRFKKKLLMLEADLHDDLISQIQYEYIETYREMNRLQTAYDAETEHGKNTIKQAEWDKKIKSWLDE